jgi:prepilin-type N-terminal cleavage/methylation domain-containing protein
MWAKQKYHLGFTIVELLIVIVVIGILAAITIVAFNGVTSKANAASAQSAAGQANKKILSYMALNSDQPPADLTAAGISNSGNTSYQYSQSSQSFCLTATTKNASYYINNSDKTQPTAGACPGHGANGVDPIINVATNPNAESDISGLRSIGSQGTTISRDTTLSKQGSASFKTVANGNSAGFTNVVSLTPGSSFRWSAYVYAQTATSLQMYGETYVGSTYVPISPVTGGGAINIPAKTWTLVTWTGNQPSGTSDANLGFLINGGAGITVNVDNVMITSGTTGYAYADGSSPSWVWNGSPNASTSTGPPTNL